jgi:hypothetical protein
MNGGWPKFVYQDCRCLFDDLSSPIPVCSLITSDKLKQARLTEDGVTLGWEIRSEFRGIPQLIRFRTF